MLPNDEPALLGGGGQHQVSCGHRGRCGDAQGRKGPGHAAAVFTRVRVSVCKKSLFSMPLLLWQILLDVRSHERAPSLSDICARAVDIRGGSSTGSEREGAPADGARRQLRRPRHHDLRRAPGRIHARHVALHGGEREG